MYQPNHRSTNATTDEDYLNVFLEPIKNKELSDQDTHIIKRAGSSQYIASIGAGTVRGMHYNEDFKKLYYCVGNTMYIWNVETNAASATLAAFFGTTSGDVGFCDYLYDNGTAVVIATDGTSLIAIDSANGFSGSADPDLPTPHVPSPVFLDGYLFLLKANTADLYNSNLNNPLAWTAGDFINAEIDADVAKAIAKLNNYIVVFGTKTIEYFWDAANATGSPLQRNDTPVKLTGAFLGGIAQHGNKIYFTGTSVNDQIEVFVLEDFKIESFSDASVSRYLNAQTDGYANWKAGLASFMGHSFYILNAGTLTYVIDVNHKLWSRWAFGAGTNFALGFSVNTKNSTRYQSFFNINGTNTIYKFDPTLYQDNGTTFTCSGVTDNQYFDSYNQKEMSRLTVWTDKPSVSASMLIQWTDDDYQTYNSGLTLDLYQERPSVNRLGRFRRRAFKWTYTNNTAFRIKSMEVNLNLGQH